MVAKEGKYSDGTFDPKKKKARLSLRCRVEDFIKKKIAMICTWVTYICLQSI